ncbi:MAG TPA: NAD-dependent epimerase/dehydratase family protein [Bacillota bacterium]|nr:NAD-dependent epimerase/dehydratase family protein [Bacillota bacterium]
MFATYLITGATGFLGSEIIEKLRGGACTIRSLVLPGDPMEKFLPPETEIYYGRIDDTQSMKDFFAGDLSDACLIHCAGAISLASKYNAKVWNINVEGTKNVLDECLAKGVGRVIYVSSVHAIPEKPHGCVISECEEFSPELVIGHYAKSKAGASAYALEMAKKGLNLSIVHPSGIIGPKDRNVGHVTWVILSYCRGRLPFGIPGGYDFVDVRDVADGILACAEKDRRGVPYILANVYSSINDILQTLRKLINGKKPLFQIPLWLLKLIAPLLEKISLLRREKLFLTPYSVYTMQSNAVFSWERAKKDLGYKPRPLAETLADVVQWLKDEKRI